MLSDSHKAKIASACKGKTRSPETRNLISLARAGKPNPLGAAALRGRTRPAHVIEKIRLTKKTRGMTDAQKASLANVCQSNRGSVRSEETKEAMRVKARAAWQIRTSREIEQLDIGRIKAALINGCTKKKIYAEFAISRNFFSRHVSPIMGDF